MERYTVYITTKLVIDVEKKVGIDTIINGMGRSFSFPSEEATIVNTEIIDFFVVMVEEGKKK